MVKKKTCIFISGKGSNLKNLIIKSRDVNFPIKISLIISNKKKALVSVMQRNIKYHIST